MGDKAKEMGDKAKDAAQDAAKSGTVRGGDKAASEFSTQLDNLKPTIDKAKGEDRPA